MARIFRDLLPPLDGKTLLDVGSRLGAVLYGAHVYSSAERIVGVEMNAEFAKISERTVTKYGMKVR